MPRQEKHLEKKLGRPPIGRGVQFNAMLRPELAARIDAWIEAQSDPKPSRPEAVRRLIGIGLAAKGKLKKERRPARAAISGGKARAALSGGRP
jgi:hypothetical protein